MVNRSKPTSIQEARRDPFLVSATIAVPGVVIELCDYPEISSEKIQVREEQPILSLGLSSLLPNSEGRFHPRSSGEFTRFGLLNFRPADVLSEMRFEGGVFFTVRCRFDRDYFARMTGLESWTDAQLAACFDIHQPRIEDAMLRLSEECTRPDSDTPAIAAGLVAVILVDLARYLREASGRATSRKGGLSARHMRRVRDRVESDDVAASVGTLAALCGFSRFHFMRAFRETTGATVGSFIEESRIRRAKSLLATGDDPLGEISRRLGYASPAAFSAAFRRATGRSPSAYRACLR